MGTKIKCRNCGQIIESKYKHDFVTCSCGETSVDGGCDYLRVCFGEAGFQQIDTPEYKWDDWLYAETD